MNHARERTTIPASSRRGKLALTKQTFQATLSSNLLKLAHCLDVDAKTVTHFILLTFYPARILDIYLFIYVIYITESVLNIRP